MFIFRAGKGMMARAPARRFLIVLKHRKINHPQRLPARFTQPVRYAKFRLADLQSQRAQTMIDHFCTIRAEEDQIAVLRASAPRMAASATSCRFLTMGLCKPSRLLAESITLPMPIPAPHTNAQTLYSRQFPRARARHPEEYAMRRRARRSDWPVRCRL